MNNLPDVNLKLDHTCLACGEPLLAPIVEVQGNGITNIMQIEAQIQPCKCKGEPE